MESNQDPNVGPTLLDMPMELLLEISDFLSDADQILLGLSCSTFRQLFRSRQARTVLPMSRNVRGRVVQLLQRDYPHEYFCFSCREMHGFCPKADLQDGTLYLNRGLPCLAEGEPGAAAPFDRRYPLRFYVAQLVMNRHFYGKPYGLPLRAVKREYKVNRLPDFSIDITWTPRIIRNRLYLSTSFTLYVTGDRDTMRDTIEQQSKFDVCPHIHLSSDARLMFELTVGRCHCSLRCQQPFSTISPRSFACKICRTELILASFPREDGWVVSYTTYHSLGPCRSPFEYDWQQLTLDAGKGLNPSQLGLFCFGLPSGRVGTGQVERVWKSEPF